jgi:hypothetical protein
MGKAHVWVDKGAFPKNEDELRYHLILGRFFWECPHIRAPPAKMFENVYEKHLESPPPPPSPPPTWLVYLEDYYGGIGFWNIIKYIYSQK